MVSVASIMLVILMTTAYAQQTEYTSIVFLAKLCTWRQSQNKTVFSSFYRQQFKDSMFRCSKQNVIVPSSQTKNIIVDVDIPCTFQSVNNVNSKVDNTLVNSTNTYDYIYEWMDYAIHTTNISLGGTIDTYQYKLFIMPATNGTVPWRGLGQLRGTYSWYNTHDLDVSLYLHEIGHNFGFGHSMKDGEEYGDDGCVMGKGSKCYTAPHRHMMLWDAPVMTFNWGANNTQYSSWNTTILLNTNGEYVLLNDNLYVESSMDGVYAYMLQTNLSTNTVCELNARKTYCNIEPYNVSIIATETGIYERVVSIKAGYFDRQNVKYVKNSASNTMLYLYEVLCISFITYNTIMFLTALH